MILGETRADRSLNEIAWSEYLKKNQSPGVNYLRKAQWTKKSVARQWVASAFSLTQFPKGLTILTMPSVNWSFEKHLISIRESGNAITGDHLCRRTYITAIERDESLYRFAVKEMPGREKGIVILEAPSFSTATMRTRSITRFHRCEFENLAHMDDFRFNGAWLDFNGSITVRRMEALQALWQRLRDRLVLTFALCRYDAAAAERVREHGDLVTWLLASLPGACVRETLVWAEPYPMMQLCVDKGRRDGKEPEGVTA